MASPATTASASSVSPSVPNRWPLLAGDDVPWRASVAVPRVHHAPVLRVATQDNPAAYAFAVMKHPDPVGEGLVVEAVAEAAGPECVVPGQPPPLRLLGLRVWPIDVELRFLEPFGRELHSMRKVIFHPDNFSSSVLLCRCYRTSLTENRGLSRYITRFPPRTKLS